MVDEPFPQKDERTFIYKENVNLMADNVVVSFPSVSIKCQSY
jgi:hypothetical protein